MGYSHGRKWDDNAIADSIHEVIRLTGNNTLPTVKRLNEITGNTSLSNAICKHGGFKYWEKRLGLDKRYSETAFGHEYERKCISELIRLGYHCEHTSTRYPYDILINGNIKIDVKTSNLFQGKGGMYYTFNLGKKMPTCDIFVCYCVNRAETVKTYVIPSSVLSGKSQLSIGKEKSQYDKYIDAWDIVSKFDKFYLSFKAVSL